MKSGVILRSARSMLVGYAPILDKSTSENDFFWSSLDEVVKGVPSRDHLQCPDGRNISMLVRVWARV